MLSGTRARTLWVAVKTVLTWTAKLVLLHVPGFLFAVTCRGGGRDHCITADLSLGSLPAGEREPSRVYRLSWCGVTSKLDVLATKKCPREHALQTSWLVSAQQNVSQNSG